MTSSIHRPENENPKMLARFQKRRRFTIAHAVLQDTSVDRPLYQDYGGKRNSFGNHDRKNGILENSKPTSARVLEMKLDSLTNTRNGDSTKSTSASSSFLTEEENNEILEILGDDCTCLVTAIARVYSASPMKQWDYINEGVICYVRDKKALSVTLRLIGGFSKMSPRPYEIWNFSMEASTKLVNRRSNFATVRLDSGDMFGIIFHNDKEGQNFVETVNARQMRRQLHREKTMMKKKESNSENGDHPPVSTTSNGVLANIGNKFSNTVKKAKKFASPGHKSKKKNKITSQEISMPTNFVHLEHKGPDGDFQVLAPAPENLSNLMLAPQIPSRRESTFIRELHTPTNHTPASNNSNQRRPLPPVHSNTLHNITESTPTLNGIHKPGQSITDARCSIRIKKEEEPNRRTPHSLKISQQRRRTSDIDSPTSSTPATENGHKPPALPKPPRTYQHMDPSPTKQPNLSRTETTRRPLPPPPSDDGFIAKPIQQPVNKTGSVKTSPPAPPPPPASTAPTAPPPPPPPPPPPSLLTSSSPNSGIPAEVNSSTRGDLMAAIRQAGGASILKEKSTTNRPKSEYESKNDAEKVGDRKSEGNGLMAALADKMNHMRKDINPSDSEDSSNEDESDEDDWSD
uniref:Uncharacterized protein n=1 Tax=Acrobeloides nanus TaxID=290746 RepID=A0A914DTR6_9BILA